MLQAVPSLVLPQAGGLPEYEVPDLSKAWPAQHSALHPAWSAVLQLRRKVSPWAQSTPKPIYIQLLPLALPLGLGEAAKVEAKPGKEI